jgi:hypothetical protein
MMQKKLDRKRLFLRALYISVFSFISISTEAHAELLPHRVQVSINMTSRPGTGLKRDQDIFYDQKAVLNVKVMNPTASPLDLRVRWTLLYDEVTTAGKIKSGNLSGTGTLTVRRGEEQELMSRMLRLNGKITKTGRLIGSDYTGYGVQIFEGGSLAYEKYEPSTLQTNAREILAAVADSATAMSTNVTAKASADPRFSATPQHSPSASAASTNAWFDLSFSTEEAEGVLRTVNDFSFEDLCQRVGLSKNAAQHITSKRPVQNLDQLAQIPYVKKQAFTLLKAFVNRK